MDNYEGLVRRTREEAPEATLFPVEPDWRTHWWGMPSFVMKDARPVRSITVNFMCREDVEEFAARLGIRVTKATDSVWFPPEVVDRPNEWEYADEP